MNTEIKQALCRDTKKGDDTEIKGHRKKYKHYVETPLITGHRN